MSTQEANHDSDGTVQLRSFMSDMQEDMAERIASKPHFEDNDIAPHGSTRLVIVPRETSEGDIPIQYLPGGIVATRVTKNGKLVVEKT